MKITVWNFIRAHYTPKATQVCRVYIFSFFFFSAAPAAGRLMTVVPLPVRRFFSFLDPSHRNIDIQFGRIFRVRNARDTRQ